MRIAWLVRVVGLAGLAGVIASVSSVDGGVSAATSAAGAAPAAASAPEQPITFHCAFDAGCPEVMVSGDQFATIGGGPAPFRGYGDPSLERDPDTGDIWLSYSWLDVLVSDPGPPPVVDFGVRTHLARSTDGGQTFTFVRAINATNPIAHPDSGVPGWTIHEVSTIAREGPGGWQSLWLTYFDPFGPPPTGTDHRSDFYYSRSLAGSPQDLGDVAMPWVRTNGTSASWGVVHNLSGIPQLSDCSALTEPALFAGGGETYLATSCVVFVGGVRRVDLERLVLLRQEADGYSYAGELLDYTDALDLGATRLEQADLALAQNGAVLLIVTPIQEAEPNHLGCVVLEVTDIATAQIRRGPSGAVVELATITGDDPSIGPGLCTYDAASQTGVLMVLHDLTASPFDLVFSLRATGVHPNGLDSDGDATADTVDPDDDGDGYWDADETAKGSDVLDPGSTPEHCDGADNDGDTVLDEAPALSGRITPDPLCAPGADPDGDTIMNAADLDDDGDGFADADERSMSTDELSDCPALAGHDSWPPDANGDGDADVGDVIQLFAGVIMVSADYKARADANGDGDNDVGDVIQLFGGGNILTECMSFALTNATGGDVDGIRIEWSSAVADVFSAEDSGLAGWSDRTIGGDGLTLTLGRPSGVMENGEFLTVALQTASAMHVATSCQWLLDGVDQGACVIGYPTPVAAAIADLASRLGIGQNQVSVLEGRQVVWSNACLGVRFPGQLCVDTITPGYWVRLHAAGANYVYHTDCRTRVIATDLAAAQGAIISGPPPLSPGACSSF